MKKLWFILIACLCIGVLSACKDDGTKYRLNDEGDGYIITSFVCEGADITIPSTYKELPVVGIEDIVYPSDSAVLNVYYQGDVADWCKISFKDAGRNPLYAGANLYIDNELVTELVIPETVTEIKENAFYGCGSLTSVKIPDTVTNIGEDAFSECDKLTSAEIGNGVTSIGGCFCFNDSLRNVSVNRATLPSLHPQNNCCTL